MAITITLTDKDAERYLLSFPAGAPAPFAGVAAELAAIKGKVEPKKEEPAKVADVVVTPALSGEDLRKAAGEKAKALGKEGPAKVKAFVASLNVKSIVDVAPEARAKALADLSALA